MGLIFVFSDDNGRVSSKQSNGLLVTLKLVDKEQLQKQYFNPEVKKMRVLIRKFAHLGLYTALGMLVYIGLKMMFTGLSRRRVVLLTLLLSGLYAVTDEIHQYFVPGRAARVEDVLIDLSGVVIGMAVCMVLKVATVQTQKLCRYLLDGQGHDHAETEMSSIELA